MAFEFLALKTNRLVSSLVKAWQSVREICARALEGGARALEGGARALEGEGPLAPRLLDRCTKLSWCKGDIRIKDNLSA